VQTASADDVGHERVAGREPAAVERQRECPQVDAVARPASSLGKVTLQDHAETTLQFELASAGPVGQLEPLRKRAQELEQGQVGPDGRFDPVSVGLGDGHRSAGDRGPERRLELPEARLTLDHPAQVVLVEIEEQGQWRRQTYTGAMEPQTLTCRIGAGLSTSESAWDAAREAAREAHSAALGQAEVDLAFVFLSPAHLPEAEAAADAVREELAPRHLLGCVAQGVVGRACEIEEGPAVAVWAGALPGAELECFHAAAVQVDDGIAVAGFPELDDPGLIVLLADPFTFPAGPFLTRLNEQHERVSLVGGIAVAGQRPGVQALILDDELHAQGAVGVVVSGRPVLTVVSQGCRPIGHESVITRCEGNVVYELAGRPAFERLRDEIAALSPEEQALAARGLLAGLVIDENRPEYDTGDFLMRGLLGADEATGALALGDAARVGQTLRFFVRDAASADADLRQRLSAALQDARPAGALLFTCNGRGTQMFPEPDHDARVVAEALGTPTLAGFFCGGEIGPVGGKAFLHGFTATLALFPEA
jgi:small ligand-binding sensory domain FIST